MSGVEFDGRNDEFWLARNSEPIIIIKFIYTRRCQLQRRVVLYRTDMWLIYLRTNTAHHTHRRRAQRFAEGRSREHVREG